MIRWVRWVFFKELVDHFRDRRSVFSALFFPLFGPLLFGGMFSVIASWNREGRTLTLPVAGREHAPNLVSFLERHGAEISTAPAEYAREIEDGKLDLTLVIPADFAKDFQAGEPAKVRLVFDSSRNETDIAVKKAQRLLRAYGAQVGYLRLMARGVSPQLAAPVDVQEEDVASPQKVAAKILNMIPLFLLMSAFIGGMHLAIDTTAGERERGSLEPLLVNPVPRSTLVLGKWLSGVVVTWLALGVSTAGFVVAVGRVPLQDLGVRATLGPREVLGTLAAVAPLSLFSVALQMWVATFARSFKEAQTYLSLLVMVPTFPGLVLSLNPVRTQAWMMAIPTLNQYLLVNGTLAGEALPASWFWIAAASTLGAAGLCVAAVTFLLGRERIVFGR